MKGESSQRSLTLSKKGRKVRVACLGRQGGRLGGTDMEVSSRTGERLRRLVETPGRKGKNHVIV